ncbi:MAG: NAD(P)H-dependent oxidoreductase [Flavobacteriales bacterium]|nr:NAD(P)H-dependent oxidoreductase [Flavobacteriales bacterium]
MISIICTTDRPESNSHKLCRIYENLLSSLGQECQILDMRQVDPKWIQESSFGENSSEFEAVVSRYIRSAEKLIFITPEYNGTFPGYVKYFMDACDYGDFNGKKAALMGLATGRGGNMRGLDHLTGILHYLGCEVYSKKVCVSQVNTCLNKEGELISEAVQNEISAQLSGFVTF